MDILVFIYDDLDQLVTAKAQKQTMDPNIKIIHESAAPETGKLKYQLLPRTSGGGPAKTATTYAGKFILVIKT